MSPQVTFHPKGRSIDVPAGTSLLEAAILAGVEVNSACAGKGVCGRCRVVVEGDVETKASPKISQEEWASGYRLACLSKVQGDCVVFVPEESQLKPMQIVGGKVSTELKELSPLVRAVYAKLRPPTLHDNDADLERLLKELGYEPGSLEVPLSLLKRLPQVIRDGEWTVTAFLDGDLLVDVRPWNCVSRNFGVAIDIGTTTVALQLVDLGTGEMISQVSDYNRQLMYGEDVLARIMYGEDHGQDRLQHMIIDTINHLLARVCSYDEKCAGKGKKVCAEEVMAVSVAGNTTMMHMLLGLDPRFIRYSPYTPVTNLSPSTNAAEIGLNVNPRASVHLVPGRASYVGGDVIADVVASGMARSEGISLLIDVGTNGEVVLGNQDWLLACSASAGPAFEGGEVCHGMRAGDGAIEKVSLQGGVQYSTI
ncbi:MAG TPA: ASKHA domain-containing protein, partial [Methanomassiliicoccales archaeon]|nr:ASKHA domain-containing protein [Methanomassiliicoccales archaeon]